MVSGGSQKDLVVQTVDNVKIVRLPDEPLLDNAHVDATAEKFARIAAELKEKALILDLSRVRVIASRGIGEIMALYNRVDKKLLLCGVTEEIRYLFQIVCLDQLVGIYETEADALAAARSLA